MMNPQYPPPGQNNNAPINPMFPPTSQDYNGVQNANVYSQMPPNGPQMQQKAFDPLDMSQKMQGMSINGPQGFQSIPPTQLPPGQAPHGQIPPGSFPQTPNYGPGQVPIGQGPPQGMPGRPPVSGAPQFPPIGQKPQMPPSSAPGQVQTSLPSTYGMPPQSQTPDPQNRQYQPPTSMQQRPPSAQPSQQPMGQQPGFQGPGQMPPHSQAGLPPPPGMGRQGIPQQGGQQPQQGLPQQPQQGLPQQPQQGLPQQPQMGSPPGMQPGQQGMPPQMGPPSQQQPGMPPQSKPPGPHGQPQPGQMQRQPGLPPQPGMMSASLPPQPGQQQQPGQMPGQQQQPGQMPGQQQLSGQMSGQPGKLPGQQHMPGPPQPGPPGLPPGQQLPPGQMQGLPQQLGMPPQPGKMGQPGMPPQPGQMGQPGMPPQLGQMGQPGQMSQPGMPPQPGQMGQSGMPPHPGQTGQSRMPPQPGQMGHPGMPPQSGLMSQPGLPPQPGMLPQPGMPPQPSQMPVQPGQMSQPGLPPQPQPGFPGQFQGQAQTMSGLPHMPPPLPQQQRQYPAQPNQPGYGPPTQQPGGAQYPTPGLPPMPNQMPPQPPMPGQQQRGFQQPTSGYPPQFPGQQQYPGQQPYPGQQYQQQPEQKRLDPDQMPSPIQVMADDQQNRGGIFVTNEKGLVPPLATTDFVVDDKGNASPRYIRSSMYTVPVTADLLKQTSMPFCLVLSPMAETVGTEQEPPLIDFAALTGSPTMGPVRCSRCKAYMCPNMKFVDAGRHFKCAFCKATTEVPMEYTQYINSMQQYGRVPAEMALGAYEIVATKEYCRNNTLPHAPAIVFVIDVSYNAIKNGLVHTVCENIMEIIDAMPRDEQTGKSWTRVGFITYSSTVHFYNIKGSLAQPQMMSVGDVGDMFVPLLEGFLVLPDESGPVLQALLQQLPLMFQDNKETETILLPAVQAGLEALKAADTSGQLLVFHTSLPTYNAPGKLINREDRKLLGTDKEKQILAPQTTVYNELGQSCCAAGVCVEMFVCNNSYVDAATIGQLPRLTGGQLHKYTYFTAEIDGPRLVLDVVRVVSRPTAHDAVMRVRTSTGVRPTDFFGHFFMSNTTDVELAAIDADKAIGIEIKHDDKLTAEDGVYIQAALLYTHRSGQRRLRVLNLALNVAHQLADVYRSMELDTCVNFLTKQAVWALREHSPRQVRETLSTRCARSLAAYRRHCASPSSAGQLVLPEPMKLLPLYTNCVLRSDAVAGGPDITCDDRSCAMYRALAADVETSIVYTYPRLLPLHRLADQPANTLQPLRASVDKMNEQGVYLLENGVHMLLWVGSQANPEFIQDVFGVPSATQIDTQVCELPALDTAANAAVRAMIDDARGRRRTAMRLTIAHQLASTAPQYRRLLVEDRAPDGADAYMDFLMSVHKAVQKML